MQLYLVLSLPLADTMVTVWTVAEDIDLADHRTCMLLCPASGRCYTIRLESCSLVMYYADAPAGLQQQPP